MPEARVEIEGRLVRWRKWLALAMLRLGFVRVPAQVVEVHANGRRMGRSIFRPRVTVEFEQEVEPERG